MVSRVRFSPSGMIADQKKWNATVTPRIAQNPPAMRKRANAASAPAASRTISRRRWPWRSAMWAISGLPITLTEMPTATSTPISAVPNPREASHTGQNGTRMPITTKKAA